MEVTESIWLQPCLDWIVVHGLERGGGQEAGWWLQVCTVPSPPPLVLSFSDSGCQWLILESINVSEPSERKSNGGVADWGNSMLRYINCRSLYEKQQQRGSKWHLTSSGNADPVVISSEIILTWLNYSYLLTYHPLILTLMDLWLGTLAVRNI